MTQAAHTNGRSELSPAELSRVHPEQRPTIVDTHAEPVADSPTNGAHTNGATTAVDQVEATLWVTALQGVDAVVQLASTLPPGTAREVLFNTLPDEWKSPAAHAFIGRMADADAAMVVAWTCRHWWDAYGLGHTHHEDGEDWRGSSAPR